MQRRWVMAIASGGGHWTQLMRLRDAFEGVQIVYVGVKQMYEEDVRPFPFHVVRDVSRLNKWGIVVTLFGLCCLLIRYRPVAIVTTGSAPGMLALRLGRLLGARGLWIDSIANVEELSLSGRKAIAVADFCLTQWEHLERPGGPRYEGSLL